jgi:cytochrome c
MPYPRHLLALLAGLIIHAAPAAAGDAVHGQQLYDSRCGACHSPDADRVGPHHRGVVGRVAGSVAGYHYSAALASAGFTWTEVLLDRWLANPQALVPGQKMNFRVNDPADRADIIAYLGSLK